MWKAKWNTDHHGQIEGTCREEAEPAGGKVEIIWKDLYRGYTVGSELFEAVSLLREMLFAEAEE